jgi:signal transduction histidine kinase/DNA-binding LytR/AlgR family response regulator
MNHLDQIKLLEVASKIQVVIFDTEGILIESCDTLFKIEPDTNLFDQFIFLESLAEVFVNMQENEVHDFPEVVWTEPVNALFNLTFRKITEDKIQWVIFDKTADYDRLLGIQQSRNESAINEEVALLQKRVVDMERQLLEFQNLELKRIQDFKNEFFAQVSHEMRTPLSSIAGLVSLIEANQQKIATYLPAIRSTSLHLNSIVNDILDISKIEAGKLIFEAIDFSLQEEVSNVIAGFQFEAQEKGTHLDLKLPSESITLKSDPIRLKQILYNLVGNSLKFTKKGNVTLEIVAFESEEGYIKLNFQLSDSAVGMTPAQMSKVLEPYAQAESSTAREFGGTGLGMGIAIKLVEAFGGQLVINSKKGKGTEISFTLRLPIGKALEGVKLLEERISGLKVLLAEDDPVNRAILNEFLISRSVELTVVQSGRGLMDNLHSEDFDLVISDVELEDKNGIEVLKELRSHGNQTPFLFVSGDASDRHSTLDEASNWEWLQKPIDLRLLSKKITQLTSKDVSLKIDLSLLENAVGGDKAFMRELLNTIYQTLPLELQLLQSAITDIDFENIRIILHKIRPSIEYLGVEVITNLRKELYVIAEQQDKELLIRKSQLFFKSTFYVINVLKCYIDNSFF